MIETQTEKLRVVLDTNVLVAAAFNRRSSAARVVNAVRDGRVHLIWNEPTRRETRRILERIPPISWARFASLFREENGYEWRIHPGWFGHVRDPDDRKFAALAYAAEAALITQDRHLLEIRAGVRLAILTPAELLAGWSTASAGLPASARQRLDRVRRSDRPEAERLR
jgi:putative PIN family toxin of toxin-antitoxin system